MTERLYYASDATEARVKAIRCTEEADGRYAVELDQTLFHPQGGGQPADRGLIAGIAVEGVSLRGSSSFIFWLNRWRQGRWRFRSIKARACVTPAGTARAI